MSESLERRPSRGTRQRRSYETAQGVEELFDVLDAVEVDSPGDPGIDSGLMTVRRGSEFTIYKPWNSLMDGVESRILIGVTPGVAVRGLISDTHRGARVEVWADRYAVDPQQRRAFRLHVLAALGLGAALAVIGGLESWLGFVYIFVYANVIIGALTYRHHDREQELRALMAEVEGRLGPLEIASTEVAPHRALPKAQ